MKTDPRTSKQSATLALIFGVIICSAIRTPARAQEASAAREVGAAAGASAVTRVDLGRAYLKFDRASQARPVPKDRVAATNKAFDKATNAFFRGKFADAVRMINEAAAALDGEVGPGRRYADAIKAEVTPSVANAEGAGQRVRLDLRLMYKPDLSVALEAEPSVPTGKRNSKGANDKGKKQVGGEDSTPAAEFGLSLRLIDDKGAVPYQTELSLAEDSPAEWTQLLEVPPLAAGVYRIEALPNGSGPVELGRVVVAAASLDAARDKNRARLDALQPATDSLREAAAIARARNELLTDTPSEKNSSTLLFDPNYLLRAVRAEIDAIERGRDPYAGVAGDVWRVLPISASASQNVPYRLYVPEDVVKSGRAVPLVIALHGAGGDENMFMDAYGAGAIKKLAERKGFIVASPATTLFAARAEALDALIRSVGEDFKIDYERIYLIGHSMGGGATCSIADKRPDVIAAAAGLAGAKPFTAQRIPPTLLIAASLDPIVPVARIKPAADQAIAAGLPVEYRELENYGHTMMVPKALPEAIDWLLGKKLQK